MMKLLKTFLISAHMQYSVKGTQEFWEGTLEDMYKANKMLLTLCYCFLLFSHKSCLTLCNLMDCKMPDFSVPNYLPECAQIQVHWVGDTT